MIQENARVRQFADNSYAVDMGDGWYGVAFGDELCRYPYSEVEAFLAEHPEALEPDPEPPSQEEIERQRVATITAQLEALDRRSIRALRAVSAGTATAEDRAILADLDTQAAELRAGL